MEIKTVWSVYWSATGATGKTVSAMADAAAEALGATRKTWDWTLPTAGEAPAFTAQDLVFFGTPTYAGKVPNKILPQVRAAFQGNGAAAAAVVLFGNRSYDNALAELTACLTEDGFQVLGAAAFVGQHAFSQTLAAGRPDRNDLETAKKFAVAVAEKAKCFTGNLTPLTIPGAADAPYYTPLGMDGQPAKFLKAKPVTDWEKCVGCGVCAASCPMGAIDPQDVAQVPGTCIKCHACVKKCPTDAKYFDDPAFLSHREMLETQFQDRKEPALFC